MRTAMFLVAITVLVGCVDQPGEQLAATEQDVSYGYSRYGIVFDRDGELAGRTLDVSTDGVADVLVEVYAFDSYGKNYRTWLSFPGSGQVKSIYGLQKLARGQTALFRVASDAYVGFTTTLRSATQTQSIDIGQPTTNLRFNAMDLGSKAYMLVANPHGSPIDIDYAAPNGTTGVISLLPFEVAKVPLTVAGQYYLLGRAQHTPFFAMLAVRMPSGWVETPL
jgi:hypothetical protein